MDRRCQSQSESERLYYSFAGQKPKRQGHSFILLRSLTMRFFLNQAIAFLALEATAPLTQAFPTGAGGCVGGVAAVGGSHLSPATSVTGTLAEGGITVSIDSVALDPGVTTKFNDTVAHSKYNADLASKALC